MIPSARTVTLAATSLALLSGLVACGSDSTDTAAPAPSTTTSAAASSTTSSAPSSSASAAAASGTVDAADQTSDGTTLTVTSVELDGVDNGWIAVHADAGGKPGPVVGFVPVTSGSNADVVVTFDAPVATGAYWPMLHVDDNTVGTYEFPTVTGADLPVMSGSDVVMKKITLTVG